MTRKKTIKIVFYPLLIIILLFVVGLVIIILYPQPLFANKVEYKQFKVYSNSNVGQEVRPVIDSVLALVKSSELFDSAFKVDLFLGYNTFFNRIDDKVFGYGPSARAIDNNIVIKVAVHVDKDLAYTTFHKPCEQRFVHLIAHEMTHCLQTHRYGILKFNPLKHPEMWKLEGYPDYVAGKKRFNETDSLKKEIARFIELHANQTDIWISVEDGGCEVPEVYYKGELMTEYLINVRHMTYDQILKDKRSEEDIYTEMIAWSLRT
jgi:hypothetical protein